MSARDGLAPKRSDLFPLWDISTRDIFRSCDAGVRRMTYSWQVSSLTQPSLAHTKTWNVTHETCLVICICSRRSAWMWYSFPQLRRPTRPALQPMCTRPGHSAGKLKEKDVPGISVAWQLCC